ncbi:MAG TPA: hypothetical protein VI756_27735, partial [Blastocatellia bacterium]
NSNLERAAWLSEDAKNTDEIPDSALTAFGKALHTITDGFSPAHAGFQVWYGVSADPIFGPALIALAWEHSEREKEIPDPVLQDVIAAVRKAFGDVFGQDKLNQAIRADNHHASVGSEADPNIQDIRRQFPSASFSDDPGASDQAEAEAVYAYRAQNPDNH